MERSKEKKRLMITAVIAAVISVFLVFAGIHITGHRIVSRKLAKDSVKTHDNYGFLMKMDDLIEKNYILENKIDKETMYRARIDALGDKFSEYMTNKEAKAWEKAVNGDYKETVKASMLGKKTGYIRITTFGKKTGTEFMTELAAIEKKNASKLVIDLRDNGGGYIDEAVKVADAILPECTVAYTEDKNGKKRYYNSEEESTKLKYALLVNKETASASEIVAAAVKDNKGGVIIGGITYGKGLIQKEFRFDKKSVVKLSVAKYFSPNGSEINGRGVTPDYKVEKPGHPARKPSKKDRCIAKAFDVLGN